MTLENRRKDVRRASDDCAQCEIWALKINTLDTAVGIINKRVDKALPWKVFILVLAAYLGLAGYNAVAVRTLTIQSAKLETKIENLDRSFARIEKQIDKVTP